jgi:hypothetical protein
MAALVESLFILPILPKCPSTNIGLIEYIKPFMLTNKNKNGWETQVKPRVDATVAPISEPVIAQKEPLAQSVSDAVRPRQRDTLFWCIFIAVNGYAEYMEMQHSCGMRELEIKKSISDYLVDHANKLKDANIKITKSMVQEIRSELITNINTTSIECVVAMAVYYGINLIIMNETKNMRLEINSCDTSDTAIPCYLIHKDGYGRYSVQTEPLTKEEIHTVGETSVCLENYLKPIRQMGSYKMDALLDMARKLGLITAADENAHKYKKQEVYNMVAQKMVWNPETPPNRKLK